MRLPIMIAVFLLIANISVYAQDKTKCNLDASHIEVSKEIEKMLKGRGLQVQGNLGNPNSDWESYAEALYDEWLADHGTYQGLYSYYIYSPNNPFTPRTGDDYESGICSTSGQCVQGTFTVEYKETPVVKVSCVASEKGSCAPSCKYYHCAGSHTSHSTCDVSEREDASNFPNRKRSGEFPSPKRTKKQRTDPSGGVSCLDNKGNSTGGTSTSSSSAGNDYGSGYDDHSDYWDGYENGYNGQLPPRCVPDYSNPSGSGVICTPG